MPNGSDKKTTNEQLEKMVANLAIRERAALSRLAGMQYSLTRDVDAMLGYTKNPDVTHFQAMYDRRGLASTIVDAPAKTTWRKAPIVSDGSEGKSEFMKAWNELQKRLAAYHYMERADRLAGIGKFGVMLIGVKDGNLDQPLERLSGPNDVIYLSPFGESLAKVNKFVTDKSNKRFGHAETYSLDFGDVIGMPSGSSIGRNVHWTRVIHIAEGLLDNEVYGEPRLQKVYNRLEDLDKVVGSSAEGYWQSAVKGYAIKAEKDYELSDTALTNAKEELQNYLHGLQRMFATEGLELKELKGEIIDPGPAFAVIISLISGKTGIPQRILLGSERGELASSMDEANWLGRVAERQQQFAEPRILRAFIDRLVDVKALPPPSGGEYEVEWPRLFYLTDKEQAEVYKDRAEAMYMASGKFPLDMFSISELREAVGFDPELPDSLSALVGQELDEEDVEVRKQFARLPSTKGVKLSALVGQELDEETEVAP